MEPGKLVAQTDIISNANLSETSEQFWMVESYTEFSENFINADFPCLFGLKSFKNKSMKMLFVSLENYVKDFLYGVREYVEYVKYTNVKDRIYSPLVVFFEGSEKRTLSEEHLFSWSVLQSLHDSDSTQWPEGVSMIPSESEFAFCFGGVPFFVNISCPGHSEMKSRNLGKKVVFIINPRENFDVVANHNSKSGIKVRQAIRERVMIYNDGFYPSVLGFYGEENNLEWKQYQLEEPGGLYSESCPLNIKNRETESL